MGLMPITMVMNNLEFKEEDHQGTYTSLILDNSSTIAVGNSFKDMKYT